MEFHQLAAAVAVADHGTFTAAAEALGISQPSISLAVRNLERELGTPLFERAPSGARVTTAGDALLGPARQVLRDRDVARAAVDDVIGLAAGTLDVGCIPAVAADLATPAIGAFRRRHPGVIVRLGEPGDGESVSELVRGGRWEVGLCVLPVEGDDLASFVLAEQDLVAVLTRGHAATRGRRGVVTLAALADLPLITAPPTAASYTQLEAAHETVGRTLRPVVETTHRDTIVPLVLAGAGAAVVPRGVAEADVASGEGVIVLDLDPPITRRVGLVHRVGVLSPAARSFVDLVHAQFARR